MFFTQNLSENYKKYIINMFHLEFQQSHATFQQSHDVSVANNIGKHYTDIVCNNWDDTK